MNSRLLLTATAVFGLIAIFDAQTANAGETTWDGSTDSDWDEADNWTPAGVPGANDYVTIPACGATFNVANCPVMNMDDSIAHLKIERRGYLTTGAWDLTVTGSCGLYVELCGTLDISAAGGTVILSGGGTSVIDGTIELDTSTSVLRVTSSDLVLAGHGRIVGAHDDASIQINSVTLTNDITIEGQLKITKGTTAGTFINNGLVESNSSDASAVLLCEENTYKHGSGGVYRVNASHATYGTLQFANSATATELFSDFEVLDGQLDIDVNVTTTGQLRFVADVISVANGVEFITG